jgi:MFS family permease
MFKERVFFLSMVITVFVVGAQYTRLVFLPLSLAELRGYSALEIGAVLTPAALCTAATMSLSGRLVDRVGARLPTILGTTTMTAGVFLLGQASVDTPIGFLVGGLSLQGLGFGLCAMPTTVASLSSLPPQWIAQAAAVRSLIGQVAAATTIAALSAVVSVRMGDDPGPARAQDAYNTAFLVMSAALVVAVVCAVRLPRTSSRRPVGRDLVSGPE